MGLAGAVGAGKLTRCQAVEVPETFGEIREVLEADPVAVSELLNPWWSNSVAAFQQVTHPQLQFGHVKGLSQVIAGALVRRGHLQPILPVDAVAI